MRTSLRQIRQKEKRSLSSWYLSIFHLWKTWLQSPVHQQIVKNNPVKSSLFVLLAPILAIIPIYSFLGSFKIFAKGFWIGLMALLFSLFTFLIFIGIPLLFLYVFLRKYTFGKIIYASCVTILFISMILWIFKYYSAFIPNLTK
jgi:hypothetical protein